MKKEEKIFDNLKKTITYILTSNVPEALPFTAFIIFQIPVPITTPLILCIDVGTDIMPGIAFSYEPPEIDIMSRKPRSQLEHLGSAEVIVFAYAWNGWIQGFSGFITYYLVMNDFGFRPSELFFIANEYGVVPKTTDNYYNSDNTKYKNPNTGILPSNYYPYGNSNLNQSEDCRKLSDDRRETLDWLYLKHSDFDIRSFFVSCNQSNGNWTNIREWAGQCKNQKLSHVSKHKICFTTEALKHAQTAFWLSVVQCQWVNVFALKSRRTSLGYQGAKNLMINYAIVVEFFLTLLICYAPGIQDGFGTRPVDFIHYGIPGLLFAMVHIISEEIRKTMLRNSSRDKEFKPTWMEQYGSW